MSANPEAGPLAVFKGATGRVLLLLCLMYFITYVDRQNVATASIEFGKEFGLGHRRLAESDIAGRILDHVRRAEYILHLTCMIGSNAQRFFGKWQGQEIVQELRSDAGPC